MIPKLLTYIKKLKGSYDQGKRTGLIFKIFLSLTILYAFLIFYLSSLSDLRIPEELLILFNSSIRSPNHSDYLILLAPLYPLIKQPDKVAHILLYFGFGILLFLTMRSMHNTISRAVILALLIGLLYGASDEFHQMFVDGRTSSIMDLVADITGLILAQVIILIAYAIIAIFSHVWTGFWKLSE
ncbi:putative integral membrane protein [Candidatus Methanoperedens nitroreducens]|uniref:Putative integral membrane protein n=1 Tax=Candidatus Methanoperedens nitratireducens TaxID=1392998 RepID=A0A062V576_9EURY|nr:VanZ family protein [Candidatus Methanoperedens nitroreducens]KCZ72457.1 putative integral membrane protein [Candidatus Methanoperedens nitroreducens]MDJ1423609.1 VanZ family protein [Candidatus Methanoperedens sp.]